MGRLDYDAEGALLFTDDGELANRLSHPRYGHERVYLVKVRGEPDPRALARMAAGVRLEDGPAHALEVGVHERAEKNVWIRVLVGEGRYHLVKRLCEAVGLFVQRLYRPEFGGITVAGLASGEYRPLAPGEVKALKQRVGLSGGAPFAGPSGRAQQLPRAARRHGHGPPELPGSEKAQEPAPGDAEAVSSENRTDSARTPVPREPWQRVDRRGGARPPLGKRENGPWAARRDGPGAQKDRLTEHVRESGRGDAQAAPARHPGGSKAATAVPSGPKHRMDPSGVAAPQGPRGKKEKAPWAARRGGHGPQRMRGNERPDGTGRGAERTPRGSQGGPARPPGPWNKREKAPWAARRDGHGPQRMRANERPERSGRGAQTAPPRNQGGSARTAVPPERRSAKKGSSKK